MKRLHFNGLLGVLVAGLGVTLYLTREQTPPAEPLTNLVASAIDRIEVAHEGQSVIRLQRDGADWRLTAPVDAPADSLEVNGILNVATLPIKKAVDAGVDPANIGLTPPAYRVTLNEQSLAFGGMEPLAFQRYVQAGDRVLLVDDPPSAALDADFSDLVSKRLLPAGAEIVRIEAPGLTLIRSDTGWSSPENPDATSDALVAVAEGWRSAQSMWNAALEADTPPASEAVTIHLADGQIRRFGIARREPQLELLDPQQQVRRTLSRALVDTLLQLPSADSDAEAAVDDTPG